jgi:hypothetical protein
MIPDDLDDLANSVRDEYIRARRLRFPGYNMPKLERDCIHLWRKIATKVKDSGTDHRAIINDMFSHSSHPYVSCLLSNTWYSGRDKAKEGRIKLVRVSLKLDADKYKLALNEGHAPREVLLDPYYDFCVLFRWVMAKWNNLEDVAAKYEADAMLVLTDHAYREVYEESFPEVFNGHHSTK